MDKLLTHTRALLEHIYWFSHDLNLQPKNNHYGTAINWTDIDERRHDFLRELINTIVSWVYSKNKCKTIIDQRLILVDGDQANASSFITTQAFSKFRPGHPQGQFGELLLFNFIQFFFKAVPLLRKQRITTSVGHERFGADAIHYRKNEDNNIFILGESKCYKSEYNFKRAFETSLLSLNKTFNDFDKELDLYTYDDFIEPELENIAINFKENKLTNTHFEFVCLIAYNENQKINGANEQEIKKSIQSIIEERCRNIDPSCYTTIEERVLSRINYVVYIAPLT